MMEPLFYNGIPMRSDGVFRSMGDRDMPGWGPRGLASMAIALKQLKHGTVRLEPGDATRYELVLVQLTPRFWCVVRLRGLEPVSSMLVEQGQEVHAWRLREVDFHQSNEWAASFLSWWLSGLMLALGRE